MRREIEVATAIIAATSLDSTPAWWPGDLFASWQPGNPREIMLHLITETAGHAGHLRRHATPGLAGAANKQAGMLAHRGQTGPEGAVDASYGEEI